MKAAIDRLENDYAVILFGDEEVKWTSLGAPSSGAKEGSWVKMSFGAGSGWVKEAE